jgi:hypothetical protein
VKDLLKLATSGLPVPVLGFVAAIGLLYLKVVSFEQAQLLVWMAIFIYVVLEKREAQESRNPKVEHSSPEVWPPIIADKSKELTAVEGKKPAAAARSTRRNSGTRRTS